jgi:saccharopine dehydrogenase-like NADP-dependent oxidoreductase
MTTKILIVGGYGTVGTALCEMISTRHPDIHVIIGGRSLSKGQLAASKLVNASAVKIDIQDADPLANLPALPEAVIVSVNDQQDHLLRAAIRRNIPLIDITRWTERVQDARIIAGKESPRSPVVLASGWMASATSIVIAAARAGIIGVRGAHGNEDMTPLDHIEIDILFSLQDQSGLDSVTHFINCHQPFDIWENGSIRTVNGFSDSKKVTFSGNRVFTCRRLNTPEQMTLAETGLAKGISVRLAFDSHFTNNALAALVGSGIWGRLSKKRRTSILHRTSGSTNAAHEFVVTVRNKDTFSTFTVMDPCGQAHFTAASTFGQLERVLGLNGRIPPKPGISLPEEAIDVRRDIEAMEYFGVRFFADGKTI